MNKEMLFAPKAQPTLKKLRARHHRLAALLASGMKPAHAAILTGFAVQTIYQLQERDPAFRELLAHYMKIEQAQFVDLARMMAGVGMDALDELQERLAEDPDSFTNKELMELLRTIADRTGYGPTHKEEKTVVYHGLADAMAKVVDGEVVND